MESKSNGRGTDILNEWELKQASDSTLDERLNELDKLLKSIDFEKELRRQETIQMIANVVMTMVVALAAFGLYSLISAILRLF